MKKILGLILLMMLAMFSSSQEVEAKERYQIISTNDYFTTYVDTNSIKSSGVAQKRRVEVTLIKKFTPLGSQWIASASDNKVKPDVITMSIQPYIFNTDSYLLRGYNRDILYYDVHGNLIYNRQLADTHYINGRTIQPSYGPYNFVPDSEAEQIKEKLFAMVGWNY